MLITITMLASAFLPLLIFGRVGSVEMDDLMLNGGCRAPRVIFSRCISYVTSHMHFTLAQNNAKPTMQSVKCEMLLKSIQAFIHGRIPVAENSAMSETNLFLL